MNKTATIDGMSYETTGSKKTSKRNLRTVTDMSTGAIILHLLHRHRHTLIAAYATVLTVYFIYDTINGLL